MNRREALKLMVAAGATVAAACKSGVEEPSAEAQADAFLGSEPLGTPPWKTLDPFLFCVHHDDAYPAGNEQFGPAASLAGREIGRDFGGKDGWSMYHGEVVPGFPRHPHRGFETVTVVRKGLIDHADSLGAGARYGDGDVQWLTAGAGINHAEMFPLLDRTAPNPVDFFQIWVNLPRASKMAQPHFSMFWSDEVPRIVAEDAGGGSTEITVVAGQLGDRRAPQPPPDSWAARAEADVAIWSIRMSPGARWTLPAARPGTNRRLYFFRGEGLQVAGRAVAAQHSVDLLGERAVTLQSGASGAELLLLQGRPIGEPVVKYGPFVMNSQEEIRETIAAYRQTGFGGWPWGRSDPVHGAEEGRFARLIDGRIVRPT
ncbi:pirin family protein [Vulgatibacter sp.]|uniref:pirin family protein n=1 Tax=Vulgatibacter sp. TaxID=1971226 RepID=UPI00356AC48F